MRVNVYVPDDLGERIKAHLPDVNVSAVLQDALRGLLDCGHERLRCDGCGELVDPEAVGGAALDAFYRELLWRWQELVDNRGTAVGAAQVAKQVAVEMGVPGAERRPLPRPPRIRHAS
jgi:hypothetical protein